MAVTTTGASSAAAAPKTNSGEKVIDLPLGSQQVLRVPAGTESVFVADPQICDVRQLPGAVLLTTKAAGETQITMWTRPEGPNLVYRIVASLPTGALQQALHEAFPGEEDIAVRSSGGAIYLTGTVTEPNVSESASHIATNLMLASGRKGIEVVNLLQTAAPQQVQVQMRFVEISRTALREMGFNAWYNNNTVAGAMFGPNQPYHYCLGCDTQRFAGPLNPVSPNANNNPPATTFTPILVSPISGTFALSFAAGEKFPLTATLSLLEQRNAAKTLSEPTLVASNGREAHFLVGGEFPIPVPDALGHILVQFKSYGASLSFTPTVLGQDTINLKLEAEVSDIDKSNGITLSSVQVPALSSRQSSTAVRLRDGQSFAVAGLLSDKIASGVAKVPLLGDLPILGALFRSVNYQRQETELVILVSVHLVKPLDPGEVPPTLNNDEFNDPGDFQLFLLGTYDRSSLSQSGAAVKRTLRNTSGPDGAVGFSR